MLSYSMLICLRNVWKRAVHTFSQHINIDRISGRNAFSRSSIPGESPTPTQCFTYPLFSFLACLLMNALIFLLSLGDRKKEHAFELGV